MKIILRFLHATGRICFGGFILYGLLIVSFQPDILLTSGVYLKIFYFFTLPAILLVVLTGILLVVLEGYLFKKEKWLQRKALISLVIMFLLPIGVSPAYRHLAVHSPSSFSDYSPGTLFYLSSVLIVILFLVNLLIALRQRENIRASGAAES